MSVTYTSHRTLTSDQQQSNEIYGILQSEKRTLILDESTFSYVYEYYYQKKQQYNLIKQIKNLTSVKGNVVIEGELFIVVFDSGKQEAQDLIAKSNLFQQGKFSGKIGFRKDGDNLKIQSIELAPDNLNRKVNIIRVGQIFIQEKPKPVIQAQQPVSKPIQTKSEAKNINGGTVVSNNTQPEEVPKDNPIPSSSIKQIQEQPNTNLRSEKQIEEEVKSFLNKISGNLSGEQSQDFIRYSIQSKKKIDQQHFQEWKNTQEKVKNTEKNIKTSQKEIKKQKEKIPEKKAKAEKKQPLKQKQPIEIPPEPKEIQLTPLQKLTLFFSTQKSSQTKQIASPQIQLINKQLTTSKIPIKKKHVLKYLQNKDAPCTFDDFKIWIVPQLQGDVKQVLDEYKKGKNYEHFAQNVGKLRSVIELCSDEKKSLKIGFGVGENKGKTSIKCGLSFRDNNEKHCVLVIDIKTKKKSELKNILENDLKLIFKSTQPYLLKLCKVNFIETQKSLKIQVNFSALEKQVFGDLITLMQSKLAKHQNLANMKFQAELIIKNSIRLNDDNMQNKRWLKWVNQGFSSSYHIQGNNQIIKLFISPLTDIFPSLKLIRSGQLNLKFKTIDNIDKLYDKLGINDLCQQLPNLSTFTQKLISEHINDQNIPLAEYFIKKYLIFAAGAPNQKMQLDLQVSVHGLNLSLNVHGDACKELSVIVGKVFVDNFN